MSSPRHSIFELAELAGVPARTVRFYVQRKLLEKPEGKKRGAYYTAQHLEKLLRIRAWTEAGLSLEAISELLTGGLAPPSPVRQPGSLEVCTHLYVADGVDLVISPDRARLSPEDTRRFARGIAHLLAEITGKPTQGSPS